MPYFLKANLIKAQNRSISLGAFLRMSMQWFRRWLLWRRPTRYGS